MAQRIITAKNYDRGLATWLKRLRSNKILLVCDKSSHHIGRVQKYLLEFDKMGARLTIFSDFQSNPKYESVVKGVESFQSKGCSGIIAIGGGSAIDVAKCIKIYSTMDLSQNYLTQAIVPNDIPFLAVPTTAGTGSEATRFAVIYYKGEKQSITSESCIPDTILFDPDLLKTLSVYQRKSTMLDALCHGIESFWSVNSTDESKEYSRQAIELVLANMDGYLANTQAGNAHMLTAAYTAGKAINIAQTTAGHAMCYKITSLYKCAHGHAAILCNRKLFPWTIENIDKCVDPRGEEYLKCVLQQISAAMGCENAKQATEKLEGIVDSLALEVPTATAEAYDILKKSVNPVRMKNHPVRLDSDAIDALYHEILR